jgi:UPF0755 protein
MKRFLLLSLFMAMALSASVLYLNSPPPMMAEEYFKVVPGETISAVAARLKKSNLIRSETFFRAASFLKGRWSVRSGRYRIYLNMTTAEILKSVASGKILMTRITIPEGFNLFQTAERLESGKICPEGDFLYFSFDREFLRSIGIMSSSAEGYLFPDTYAMPEDSDARDIIYLMNRRQEKIINELSSAYREQEKLHSMLILASMIEEEARIPSERAYISSVFHNRLKKDWRLDCDPTLRSGLRKIRGPLTRRDLGSDSPFNTYTHRGLPPTPICCPGRDSIRASMEPARSAFYFFVSRNNGTHYFSKTLSEHSRAVRFYQRGEKIRFTDRQRL